MLTHCPAGQWMVRANHGAVDRLQGVRHHPAFVQRVHDLLPEPRQCPAPELPVGARPLAELLWQVAPRRARVSGPENPIKIKSVIGGLRPIRGADGQNGALK